ncbi:PfkB family carbohydrate kinase [Leadbetterella sp. DM7]|uniref:PfkB family carbohydrate kinase n=1 Tax=Leadbetterella sp. DM7 TaxID=3235085 RepID=UPI00349E61F2
MVLTFGEILLRLSPKLGGTWIREASFPVFVGGAELNVATALANWQIPVAYCSAMPDNALSREIETYLGEKNIRTGKLIWSGDRIGIYMLPQGADLKNAGVIYDRAHSSFSALKKGDIAWDALFEGVRYFHLSAISPALNGEVAALCTEAARQATLRGITVTFDLNYRSKLWKYGKAPAEIVPEIVQYCDVIMGNIWAAHTLLGTDIDPEVAENRAGKEDYLQQARLTSGQIMEKFPKVKAVANTFRFDAGREGINYYATWLSGGDFVVSKEFDTDRVVDKVGSGDCFMAGLLYGLYRNLDARSTVNFAASAAFGKLREYGDASGQTVTDVLTRIEQ